MNISNARNIALDGYVLHLGGRYSHTDGNGEQWYFSPFRPNEKTASFKLHKGGTRWYDFGHGGTGDKVGSGGDILDLWSDYYGKNRRGSIKQALEALAAYAPTAGSKTPVVQRPKAVASAHENRGDAEGRYRILKLHGRIFYKSLLAELTKRRISPALAAKYLHQAYLQDTAQPDKKLNGFAFANDACGHELSIPNPVKGTCFKTSTKPKAPTTFRVLASNKVWVFEGFWDFLSWLEMQGTPTPEHNVVVLNSLSFCGRIAQQIIAAKEQLETVVLFQDNDDAGVKAMHHMTSALDGNGFAVRTMEQLYRNYKDLSEYWQRDPDAKRIIGQQQAQTKYYTGDSAWATATKQHDPRPR